MLLSPALCVTTKVRLAVRSSLWARDTRLCSCLELGFLIIGEPGLKISAKSINLLKFELVLISVSGQNITKHLGIFWLPPSPLYELAADLYYKIHATSLTWSPSPSNAYILYGRPLLQIPVWGPWTPFCLSNEGHPSPTDDGRLLYDCLRILPKRTKRMTRAVK